jgi:hypothetical protein
MLARSFLSAADLGISDQWRDALIAVLGKLERDELTHLHAGDIDGQTDIFNMVIWYSSGADCGTVGCIGGWAETIGQFQFPGEMPDDLDNLFYPPDQYSFDSVTTDQAAAALSNYLTVGSPCWRDVLGEPRS